MVNFLIYIQKDAAERRDRVVLSSGGTTRVQISVGILAIKTEELCGFIQLHLVYAGISPYIKQGQFPPTSCPICYSQNIQLCEV